MQLAVDCVTCGRTCVVVSTRRLPAYICNNNIPSLHPSTFYELLSTLNWLLGQNNSLVVIDGLQSLAQSIMGAQNYKGQALLTELKSVLVELSRTSLVVYTNGIVSDGQGDHIPALGRTWSTLPFARVMLLVNENGQRVLWRNFSEKFSVDLQDDGNFVMQAL